MYQLYHSKLPQKVYVSFSKLTEIHNHNNRNTKLLTYFIPRINKNFCKNLLSYRGSIAWGQIDAEFKGMQWISFKQIIKNICLVYKFNLIKNCSCYSQMTSIISRCHVNLVKI